MIWVFPKIMGKPPKSSLLIGFSIIFTIHFGGFSPYFWVDTHILQWIQGTNQCFDDLNWWRSLSTKLFTVDCSSGNFGYVCAFSSNKHADGNKRKPCGYFTILLVTTQIDSIFLYTPSTFNMVPLKNYHPKRKVVFQTTCLRGYINLVGCSYMHDQNWKDCSNLKKLLKSLDLCGCFLAPTVSSNEVTWSYWPFFSKYFTWHGGSEKSWVSTKVSHKNSSGTQQLSAPYHFRFSSRPCTIILLYLKYASNGSYVAREITRHVHHCDSCISAKNSSVGNSKLTKSSLIHTTISYIFIHQWCKYVTLNSSQPRNLFVLLGVLESKAAERERERNWVILDHSKHRNFFFKFPSFGTHLHLLEVLSNGTQSLKMPESAVCVVFFSHLDMVNRVVLQFGIEPPYESIYICDNYSNCFFSCQAFEMTQNINAA